MSKWYKPRLNYKIQEEHTREVYTVEYDGYPEIETVVEFHFKTREEAEEFYKENKESSIVMMDNSLVDYEDYEN